MDTIPQKAYVVAIDMGYGHQRAAYPLVRIATTPPEWKIKESVIISANNYPGIPGTEKFRWEETRRLYEWFSRMKGFPFFGARIFNLMDRFQRIAPFYPRRDLTKPDFALRRVYRMIRRGLGKHLIETFNKHPLPLICSFATPAFCAEEHGYKGDIYCLCTDTDISRAWAPLHPERSRIIYLAPTVRTKERLKLYGVRPENIVVTGFPLPENVLGDRKTLDTLRRSLERRIYKLDPRGIYQKKYAKLLSLYLGSAATYSNKPLSILFAIGGAGAQSDIGVSIIGSLRSRIDNGTVRLLLSAGTSKAIYDAYKEAIKREGLQSSFGKTIDIIFHSDKFEYFKEFNDALIETDILWTKPSELSFYAGLGLPIIMAPALGSHEDCNKAWLHMIGAGFEQEDPRYTHEWLFDWLASGWLAEAAMNGFMDAPKRATYHIEDLALRGERTEIEDIHFI